MSEAGASQWPFSKRSSAAPGPRVAIQMIAANRKKKTVVNRPPTRLGFTAAGPTLPAIELFPNTFLLAALYESRQCGVGGTSVGKHEPENRNVRALPDLGGNDGGDHLARATARSGIPGPRGVSSRNPPACLHR